MVPPRKFTTLELLPPEVMTQIISHLDSYSFIQLLKSCRHFAILCKQEEEIFYENEISLHVPFPERIKAFRRIKLSNGRYKRPKIKELKNNDKSEYYHEESWKEVSRRYHRLNHNYLKTIRPRDVKMLEVPFFTENYRSKWSRDLKMVPTHPFSLLFISGIDCHLRTLPNGKRQVVFNLPIIQHEEDFFEEKALVIDFETGEMDMIVIKRFPENPGRPIRERPVVVLQPLDRSYFKGILFGYVWNFKIYSKIVNDPLAPFPLAVEGRNVRRGQGGSIISHFDRVWNERHATFYDGVLYFTNFPSRTTNRYPSRFRDPMQNSRIGRGAQNNLDDVVLDFFMEMAADILDDEGREGEDEEEDDNEDDEHQQSGEYYIEAFKSLDPDTGDCELLWRHFYDTKDFRIKNIDSVSMCANKHFLFINIDDGEFGGERCDVYVVSKSNGEVIASQKDFSSFNGEVRSSTLLTFSSSHLYIWKKNLLGAISLKDFFTKGCEYNEDFFKGLENKVSDMKDIEERKTLQNLIRLKSENLHEQTITNFTKPLWKKMPYRNVKDFQLSDDERFLFIIEGSGKPAIIFDLLEYKAVKYKKLGDYLIYDVIMIDEEYNAYALTDKIVESMSIEYEAHEFINKEKLRLFDSYEEDIEQDLYSEHENDIDELDDNNGSIGNFTKLVTMQSRNILGEEIEEEEFQNSLKRPVEIGMPSTGISESDELKSNPAVSNKKRQRTQEIISFI